MRTTNRPSERNHRKRLPASKVGGRFLFLCFLMLRPSLTHQPAARRRSSRSKRLSALELGSVESAS